jgi:uncharacterized membrane protein YfcA
MLTQNNKVNQSIRKQAVGFDFVEGDVKWDYQKVFFYARWTFVAGVIAGLIGIGGGMVLGPLMLQMGILPQVQLTYKLLLTYLVFRKMGFSFRIRTRKKKETKLNECS